MIANTPRTDFVRVAHGKLGDFKAARTQVHARARAGQFLSNVIAALRADRANGFPTLLGDPAPVSEANLPTSFLHIGQGLRRRSARWRTWPNCCDYR